ncbi:MAG: response regulator [Thermodesulfobacteriota bacterium]|jgi:CheY-like chemotaxis protein
MRREQQVIHILLVEDNPGDVRLFQEALKQISLATLLRIVDDGEQALAFLQKAGEYHTAPTPQVVFLDSTLPKEPGYHVLAAIRRHPTLRSLPVYLMLESEYGKKLLESAGIEVGNSLVKTVSVEELEAILRQCQR